jgi:putative ATPase
MDDAHGDAPNDARRGLGQEILTWSAVSKGREGWFKRLESGRSALLLADRDRLFGQAHLARHDRILIPSANDGLLLWEGLRRVPEGLAAALVDTGAAREALLRFSASLDEPEQPRIALFPPGDLPSPEETESWFSTGIFDHICAREPWRRSAAASVTALFTGFAAKAEKLLGPGGDLLILQSPPRLGERLSRILEVECGAPGTLSRRLGEAEEAFFKPGPTEPPGASPGRDGKGEASSGRWTWDGATLEGCFSAAGFETEFTVLDEEEERLISPRDIELWFNRDRSSWGAFICSALGEEDFFVLRDALQERARQGPIRWKWKSLLLKARKS